MSLVIARQNFGSPLLQLLCPCYRLLAYACRLQILRRCSPLKGLGFWHFRGRKNTSNRDKAGVDFSSGNGWRHRNARQVRRYAVDVVKTSV